LLSIKRILHPTDFSDLSSGAFHIASSLAQDYAANLIILHVYPPLPLGSDSTAPQRVKGFEDSLWQQLKQIKPDDATVPVDYHIIEGFAADEIVRSAQANKADLIVLGTHGRGGLRRALMGSVAEKVLRSAPCPVMTVNWPVAMAEAAVHQPAMSTHGVCRPNLTNASAAEQSE
jgi:nucleotide-binding universal stress UspA family protein